jgi:diguanylate cyclase (GGDEF)-like protein
MATVSLKQRIHELQQTAVKLSEWLSELEMFTTEANAFFEQSNLLFEQGNLLIAAREREEAYNIVANLAKLLFPTESGILCLHEPPDLVKVVADWGAGDAVGSEFSWQDCWALKGMRPHLVSEGTTLRCRHVKAEVTNYFCAPMMAQGQALGVLHLHTAPGARDHGNGNGSQAFPEAKQRLALGVAHHIAHGLANLRLREILLEQATQDSLTGLLNPRAMLDKLSDEVRRAIRGRRPGGVIMFDIDHFKKYNSEHTHEGANQLLKGLGAFLKTKYSRRAGDAVCRYGGEEFLLILPETPREVCRNLAERLRQEVQQLEVKFLDRRLPPVTLSLGVAGFPDHGETPEAVLRVVAAALQCAKKSRNRVVDADQIEPTTAVGEEGRPER